MRRVLGALGTRGIVVVAVTVVVALLVGIGRLIGGNNDTGVIGTGDRTIPSTVDPSNGDDGPVDPTTTPTATVDDAPVLQAAATFTTAWMRRDLSAQAWHDRIADLATKQLADSLVGVDPKSVPATRTTGSPAVALRAEGFAQVAVPVDTGTVRLSLISSDGRWLVDGVDWERT